MIAVSKSYQTGPSSEQNPEDRKTFWTEKYFYLFRFFDETEQQTF
jgi:hypothetical protein